MFCDVLVNLLQETTAYKVAKATGITETRLSRWKNSKELPSAENLIKLADYFDVSVDYLLGRASNISLLDKELSNTNEMGNDEMGDTSYRDRIEAQLKEIQDKGDAFTKAMKALYDLPIKNVDYVTKAEIEEIIDNRNNKLIQEISNMLADAKKDRESFQ